MGTAVRPQSLRGGAPTSFFYFRMAERQVLSGKPCVLPCTGCNALLAAKQFTSVIQQIKFCVKDFLKNSAGTSKSFCRKMIWYEVEFQNRAAKDKSRLNRSRRERDFLSFIESSPFCDVGSVWFKMAPPLITAVRPHSLRDRAPVLLSSDFSNTIP